MTILTQYSEAINKLCALHKVKRLYVFGSALTAKFNDDSDIDLLVDFAPMDVLNYADNYYDLKFSLQDMLKRPVDLLEEKAIKNPYFRDSISQHTELIYGH